MTSYMGRADHSARETELELRNWLLGGFNRSDGRLAIFDTFGEPVDKQIIRSAISAGFAEPWFSSPMRPQWTVCRLTPKGRSFVRPFAKTK